jgi:hypothetical protein
LGVRRTAEDELGGGNAHRRSSKKATTVNIDIFEHFDRFHWKISFMRWLAMECPLMLPRAVGETWE